MRVHTIRQSDLNTFFHCPEQLRLRLAGKLPRTETDATAIGTSMHAGIEAVLRDGVPVEDGLDVALAEWLRLEPTITNWAQIKKPETARRYVSNLYVAWMEDVFPRLGQVIEVEHKFKHLFHQDDERQIWLSGAIDYVEVGGVWDWKTAARPYEAWEVDRFKIQPTVYCWAVTQSFPEDFPVGAPVPFTYGISLKGAKPKAQLVGTARAERHYEWLRRQVLALALLIEADLPTWPLDDQGWWCSAKWCPAWDDCKGQVMDLQPADNGL